MIESNSNIFQNDIVLLTLHPESGKQSRLAQPSFQTLGPWENNQIDLHINPSRLQKKKFVSPSHVSTFKRNHKQTVERLFSQTFHINPRSTLKNSNQKEILQKSKKISDFLKRRKFSQFYDHSNPIQSQKQIRAMTPPPYMSQIKSRGKKCGSRKLTPKGSQMIKQQIEDILKGNFQKEEEKRKKYCPDVVKVCPERKKSNKIEYKEKNRQVEKKIIMILQ